MKPIPSSDLTSQSSQEAAASLTVAEISIEGIREPAILSYFQRLNAADFLAASELFAEDGMLQPPFETPLEGRDAIAAYLQTEAKGLILYPQQGTVESLEGGDTKVKVVGKVQTTLFIVNICWEFHLNPSREICLAKINLLASLQELLHLRNQGQSEGENRTEPSTEAKGESPLVAD